MTSIHEAIQNIDSVKKLFQSVGMPDEEADQAVDRVRRVEGDTRLVLFYRIVADFASKQSEQSEEIS